VVMNEPCWSRASLTDWKAHQEKVSKVIFSK